MQASRASGTSARPVLQPCRLPSWHPSCHASSPGNATLLVRAVPPAHAVAQGTAEATTPLLTPDAIVSLPLRQPQQQHEAMAPAVQRRRRRSTLNGDGHGGMTGIVHGGSMQGAPSPADAWHAVNSTPPHASELQGPGTSSNGTPAWLGDGAQLRAVAQLVQDQPSTSYGHSTPSSGQSQPTQHSGSNKGRGRHRQRLQQQHETNQQQEPHSQRDPPPTARVAPPIRSCSAHPAINGQSNSDSSQHGAAHDSQAPPRSLADSKAARRAQQRLAGLERAAAHLLQHRRHRRAILLPVRVRGKLMLVRRPLKSFQMTVSQTSDLDVWGAFLAAQQGVAPPLRQPQQQPQQHMARQAGGAMPTRAQVQQQQQSVRQRQREVDTTLVVPPACASQWVRALRHALHESGNAPAASVPGRSRRPEDNLCVQFSLQQQQGDRQTGPGRPSAWRTARLVHRHMPNGELSLAAELPACLVPGMPDAPAPVLHVRLALLQCGAQGTPVVRCLPMMPGSVLQLQPGASYQLLSPPAPETSSMQSQTQQPVPAQEQPQTHSLSLAQAHAQAGAASSSSSMPVQRLLCQPVMLVAELAMVSGRDSVSRDDDAARRFRRMWEASQALQPSMLVYTTHRCWRSFLQTWICKQAVLASPDVVLLAGGTRIVYKTAWGQWQEDEVWRARLESDRGWSRPAVVRAVQRVAAAFNNRGRDSATACGAAGQVASGQRPVLGVPGDGQPAAVVLVKPDVAKEQNAHRVRVLVRAHVAHAFAAALEADLYCLASGSSGSTTGSTSGGGRSDAGASMALRARSQSPTPTGGSTTGRSSSSTSSGGRSDAGVAHGWGDAAAAAGTAISTLQQQLPQQQAVQQSLITLTHHNGAGVSAGWGSAEEGGGSISAPGMGGPRRFYSSHASTPSSTCPASSSSAAHSLTWSLTLQPPHAVGVRSGSRASGWAALDIVPACAGEAAALQHVCNRFRIHPVQRAASGGQSAGAHGVPIVVAGRAASDSASAGASALQRLATHSVLHVRPDAGVRAGGAASALDQLADSGVQSGMRVARSKAWGADALLEGLVQLGLM